MGISSSRVAENPFSVDGTEASKGVAEGPALIQSGFQSICFFVAVVLDGGGVEIFVNSILCLSLIFGNSFDTISWCVQL